jgi:predicted PurR-regulated permease PerM
VPAPSSERRSPAAAERDFGRRVRVVVGTTAATVIALLLAWHVVDVLLTVFAAILFAIFLRGLADALSARTRMPRGSSLAVVGLVLVALVGAGGWLLAGDVAAEVDQLARDLPRALGQFAERLEQYEWGRWVLGATGDVGERLFEGFVRDAPGVLTRTLGTTLGLLATVVIVVALGIYLAVDADVYARGVLHLLPKARRRRGEEVLAALQFTLQWWLIGKVVVMAVVGVLTGVGLWLIGLPLALTLGLMAGLLDFIPYVGPVLAFGPAILLALTQDATLALWVGALYLVVQSLESYVLTPVVQWRAVSLPPALTIVSQVVLTVLFGVQGLLLATPLTAAGLVLVKMLYVEDALGDRMELPGADRDVA